MVALRGKGTMHSTVRVFVVVVFCIFRQIFGVAGMRRPKGLVYSTEGSTLPPHKCHGMHHEQRSTHAAAPSVAPAWPFGGCSYGPVRARHVVTGSRNRRSRARGPSRRGIRDRMPHQVHAGGGTARVTAFGCQCCNTTRCRDSLSRVITRGRGVAVSFGAQTNHS